MSARCSPERAVRELIQRLRNQAIVARWIGEQAVTIIRRELAIAWEAGRTGAAPVDAVAVDAVAVDAVAVDPTGLRPGDIGDVEAPLSVDLDVLLAGEPVVAGDEAEESFDEDLPGPAEAPGTGSATAAPFDGYDTLPASHIVQRLRRMSPDDLRRVRAFEAAHRNRRTVLAMVDQLLAG